MVEKRFEKLGMPDIERFENYLPTAFNSELTLLQKVNKIIFDLMETNKLTNEMVDYLNNFIETFDEKLYDTIYSVLNKWLLDGILTEIIEDVFNEFLSKAKQSIHGSRIISLTEFPKLIGEETDGERIQRMIDTAKPYDILEFADSSKLYLGKETIILNKPLTLHGYGCELVVDCDCTAYAFKVLNTQDVLVDGFKFNQNLKGRNALWFEDCHSIKVLNCSFSGYTAEFGYYKTDSALMMYNVNDYVVDNCKFIDFGFQYGTATATLNRCITQQGLSDNGVITKCLFERVNQAIVSDSGSILVDGCVFKQVKDNDLYLLGGSAIVTNCFMNDYFDECVVMGNMDYVSVSDCVIKNVPNKAIAITGNCGKIVLSNIDFINDEVSTGQLIIWRTEDLIVDSLTLNNIHFENNSYTFPYRFIEIFNVEDLTIDNLKLKVHMMDNQNILSFKNVKGIFKNFSFNKLSGEGYGNLEADDLSQIYLSNISLSGARFNKKKAWVTSKAYVQTNTGNPYYSRDSDRSIIYVDNEPQPQNESNSRWYEGDVAINISPDTNTSVLMWVFSKGSWVPLHRTTDKRTGTFSPNDKARSTFAGEIFVRSDLGEAYIAMEANSFTSWKKITTS